MNNMIPTPKISEILLDEYMAPMNLSTYRLAQEIHVPVSQVQDILYERRKITAGISLRLAEFFGVSDQFFLEYDAGNPKCFSLGMRASPYSNRDKQFLLT